MLINTCSLVPDSSNKDISSYPSAEVYAASHDQGPEYDAYMDEIQSKYQAIFDTEIYRKVFTIN